MILALIFAITAECREHERFDRPDPRPSCDRARVALCVSQHEVGARSASQQIASLNERIAFVKTEASSLGVAFDDVEKKTRAIDVNLQSARDEIDFLPLVTADVSEEKFLSNLFEVKPMDLAWFEPYPDERKSVLIRTVENLELERTALTDRKAKLKQQLDSYNSSCSALISERETHSQALDLHGRMISSGCQTTHCAE